ncbi:BREX-1 system phosphatase PglZ type A [Schnuerera sp. xch1]|uniref:BREX-1 system phosphatase PglZ type A n=1 Tax=Schnuerera sp. xch1 TaxID=2874283 RepID=UPI001CC01AC1|nr:BREX-1 system phosphatase PglZ type A [Schnuerera sp. xch1]MBZ2174148.1 BREX-1 system phosphatase PglZ type A [Schnuerera sp. xch1]
MNSNEVKRILEENLNKEPSDGKKRNIVFWYDDEGEFIKDIDELELENTKIIKLEDNNSFYIKYSLEKEDTESNYLIYSSKPKPNPRENWLLDIFKYSEEFFTDKATVNMRSLGIEDDTLKSIFKKYTKFFNNKERLNKFASYNIENYTEEKIDIAVLSTLCKLSVLDFELVVKSVLMEEAKEENKYIKDIEKFGDIDAFWKLIETRYGYHMEERDLESLMIMFMITNLSYNLDAELPKAWEKFISNERANSIILLDHFMSHKDDREVFNVLANRIEDRLNLEDYIKKWDIDDYISCDTFKSFDLEIISRLINNLVENVGEYEKYRKIINKRRTTHWYNDFEQEYNAIYYAMEILKLQVQLQKTLIGSNAFEMVNNYAEKYYLFDYYYRKFYLSYDSIRENKELFNSMLEIIENTYTNWYLDELSIKWSAIIEDELKDDIRVQGLTQQKDFYNNFIRPHVEKNERVFVIVSDAFRYEAAVEFNDILNKERRGSTELAYMQGSIPSYTKLGMATLLPHKAIDIDNQGRVKVDGVDSQGTQNRQKIILNYSSESVAIQYNDIKDMKRDEYKEVFTGKKLVYIYHNVIDALGDTSLTEREVFEGVERTFNDLNDIIRSLVNNVSATNIYITADHGFIYRRSKLMENNKLSKMNVSSIEESRRFILTEEVSDEKGILNIPLNYLIENTKLNAIVPKGNTRFKVQGAGDNYVHGGTSLQEIIIPVIKFKNIRKDEFKSSKVEVKLTNISRKITNRITYLEFFQTGKVEDKKLPINLKLYFEDDEGNRISNENIIIADSRSSKPEERTFREKFTLKDQSYDKGKKYYLVMEDENETVENIYSKTPFIIDLAITNDFGF